MNLNINRMLTLLFIAVLAMNPLTLAAAEEAQLVDVPYPNLSELDPRVRKIVEPALDYFERTKPFLSGPQLGRAYGRIGLVFQAFRMQEAAGASYRNAIALNPEDPLWHYYLAIYLEETGELEEALVSFRRVLAMEPNYPNTLMRIGLVSLEAGKLEAAREAFDQLLAEHPELSAPGLAGLGTIALREKDFPRAIDLLQRALVLQPQATQLHYRLAQAYRQIGETEMAREHLAQRGDRIAWAPDPWVENMKARSRHPDYYVQQGVEAVNNGEMDRAMTAFRLALALDPENVDVFARLAVLIGMGERREEAADLVQQALALDPDHGLANSLQGAILAEAEQFEEAQAYYFRAVTAEPDNFEFRLQFANGLMRLADFEAAARQYAEALQRRPNDFQAHYGRAVALAASGQCEEAITTVESGVESNPRVATMLDARARLYATCPGADENERRVALEDALLLYDQRPDAGFAETVAMAMAANGRFEEAMDYQGQAIFEAIKTGDRSSLAVLRGNMQRFEANLPAEAAWGSAAQQ